jgi:hypothetical protein
MLFVADSSNWELRVLIIDRSTGVFQIAMPLNSSAYLPGAAANAKKCQTEYYVKTKSEYPLAVNLLLL